MKSPRRQGTIVVDLGYNELKISDDTLLVRENWSAQFVRVVAPCIKEARGDVGTFSSGDFSDVSELTKGSLVANRRYVKNISQTHSFLRKNAKHFILSVLVKI